MEKAGAFSGTSFRDWIESLARCQRSLSYSAATGSRASASAAFWSRSQARRDIFTRPFSSTPRHLAVMVSPFLTMSCTAASSLMLISAPDSTWNALDALKTPKIETLLRRAKLSISPEIKVFLNYFPFDLKISAVAGMRGTFVVDTNTLPEASLAAH